jgi:hypothetical protein
MEALGSLETLQASPQKLRIIKNKRGTLGKMENLMFESLQKQEE